MLGRVLNTHQQWLCRQLADLGYQVTRQIAIADAALEIQSAVRESLARADLVIVTGGLGPTSDDITRELIAGLLGKKLRMDRKLLDGIEKFFAMRKKILPESSKVQALVPVGATVLPNRHGTAPGLAMEVKPGLFRKGRKASWLIMLPGPPRELRPMFMDSVVPLINKHFPLGAPFVCRTIRTSGIGESFVQERIADKMKKLVGRGLELGYCARVGQVDVRLSARQKDAEKLVEASHKVVSKELAGNIYGWDADELETVLVHSLTKRKQTLAIAESCTGGAIANHITNVPGSSAVLLAGFVTYSNEAKQKSLGVREETLTEHGAVSKAVAKEMAEGARKQTGSDYALSVTGIAGPSGGSETKPVGTVFIGLAGPFPTIVVKNFNPYDRLTFKEVAATQAMELLRRKLVG